MTFNDTAMLLLVILASGALLISVIFAGALILSFFPDSGPMADGMAARLGPRTGPK